MGVKKSFLIYVVILLILFSISVYSINVKDDVLSDSNGIILSDEVESSNLIKEKGSLISIQNDNNISSYYIEIGAVEEIEQKEINIYDKNLVSYGIGVPTIWSQRIVLKNLNSSEKEFNLNLFNQEESIGVSFLADVETISILLDDKVISNTFAIVTTLNPYEQKEILIQYQTPELKVKKTCNTKRLSDIIPKEAVIKSSNFNLDEILRDSCKISLYYDSEYVYPEMNIKLSDLSDKKITQVINSDSNKSLNVMNGFIPINWSE